MECQLEQQKQIKINIMDHVGYVKTVANKFRRQGHWDDLCQEGMIALHIAAETFDPAYGVHFLTYARYRVHHRIAEYCRKLDFYNTRADDIDNPEDGQGNKVFLITQPIIGVETKILLTEITERVSQLPERNRDILVELYYLDNDNVNHSALARKLGISRQRVHQLAAASLNHLREGLKDGR